ncbi:RTA1 like protein-domain-containing protein [Irpex lacteus]|nr:RTA1 like protein-domain-containing protein [Irpex lacteus]
MLSTALEVAADISSNSTSTDGTPKHDPHNPLGYITNNVLTTIGLVLTVLVAITQTWLIIKTKAKYMLVLVIAECCYAIGIAARYGLHYQPDSKNIYIIEYLFITLSPCGFVAAEYVILGRLVHWVKGDRYLLIRPSWVTKVFVASDVITFLIQAFGGTIIVSHQTDIDKIHLGEHLALLGLILQLVSFVFFTFMFLHFVYKIHKHEPQTWGMDRLYGLTWYNDWRAFVLAVGLSCVGVLVRSVYRTIEFAAGSTGPLTTTEIYFWVLDFIPLIIAVGLYIPFWPGRFIGRDLALLKKGGRLESSEGIQGAYGESMQSIPLYSQGA